MARTITIGNYKGGVGKTTNSVMIGFSLSRKKLKTLVIDIDAQANATKLLMLSQEKEEMFDRTIMDGIRDEDFSDLIIPINEYLDLIPAYKTLEEFPEYLYTEVKGGKKARDFVIKNLGQEVFDNYDYVIIDVPPQSKEVTRNAVVASDFVLISLQTQERSLTGAESYLEDLANIKEEYDLDIDIIGILPVLLKNDGRVDMYILDNAKESFGEDNIFKNHVPQLERLKRFDVNGISDEDYHDKRVLKIYEDITDELLERLKGR